MGTTRFAGEAFISPVTDKQERAVVSQYGGLLTSRRTIYGLLGGTLTRK